MKALNLPQQDDAFERKKELEEQAAPYTYNHSLGLPLAEAEGPFDRNHVDWTIKTMNLLMEIRANLQDICDKSGFDFMHQKPLRNIPRFLHVLRNNGSVNEYFAPDLGFIRGPSFAKRPFAIEDYIDKVFYKRGEHNKGIARVPEIARRWDSNVSFAYTFLAGPNPCELQRYDTLKTLPDFPLETIDLSQQKAFAGDSIRQAIEDGRVYILDRSDMTALFSNMPGAPAPNASPRYFEGVKSDDWKYIYAPYAAFALPRDGRHILPIGIQCGPRSEGHQIYTPLDGYSWKMARVCALAAHNNHHEVVAHLGTTHLLIDPIVMATRLKLHQRHPVHKLLNAHFEGTISINVGARTSLILPGKPVDRLVGSKIEHNYPYLVKERLNYSFRGNFLERRLEARGLNNVRLLPHYPYRDDGLDLWRAIGAFAQEFVSLWYRSEAQIIGDYELQEWAKEICGVGQVKDFTIVPNQISTRDELAEILTMIIFTAGPAHAAVNFTQGTDMTFVPANPLAGYRQAPEGPNHSEQDLLDILPPMDVAVETWSILTLLAGIRNTRLGDYRQAFMSSPNSEAEIIKFNANLRSVEKDIEERNRVRVQVYGLEYEALLPSKIPASINI